MKLEKYKRVIDDMAKPKRVFGTEDLFLAIAIVLLLFTPLIGGYWWWPLIVVAVIIILALVHVLRRTPR